MRLVPSLRAISREAPSGPARIGDIGARVHQIDQRVGQHDVERDVGMLAHEARHQRHHMQHAERDVGVDGEMAARHAGGGLERSASSMSARMRWRALIERLAFLGELQLARGAVDQPCAEPRLQPRHQLADAPTVSWRRLFAAAVRSRRGRPRARRRPSRRSGWCRYEPWLEFTSQMIGFRPF